MSFEEQIKEWVQIDNQIKQYNTHVKHCVNKKIIYQITLLLMRLKITCLIVQ